MKLIVALVSFSPVTSEVVGLASQLARGMSSRLVLMHVAMPDSDFVDDERREDVSRQGIASELRHRHRDMAILEMEMKKLGIDASGRMVRGESVRGNPVRKIVEELEQLAPDLVILGYGKRGPLHRLFGGSVAEAVARKAHCPVLLVRNSAIAGGARAATDDPSHRDLCEKF